LGCGGDKLPGFVNIDYRPASAADVVMDLNRPRFAPGSVAFAFSNAFFEHLYRDSRMAHLQAMREAIAPTGAICYIGIPYFRNIAKQYVERGPGTAGPLFDLFNVYRYTHGNPEQAPTWWAGQLHKSLFDEEELSSLLNEAGLASHVLFAYAYPDDTNPVAVTMGFYAARAPASEAALRKACLAFLGPYDNNRIVLKSLTWLTAV
jgi:predicted SAM-dependent methyltransferase